MNSRPIPPNPSADLGFVSDLIMGHESELVTRTFGHPHWHADGDLLAMAFAPDGTLWTVEEPGVVRQWDAGGKPLARVAVSEVETLWTFSPGARYVAAGSDDLTVWDVAARKQVAQIPQPSWVTAVAFHPTRRLVATGHDDGTVRLWDLDGGDEEAELGHGDHPVSAVAFTTDGALLASASEDRSIAVWDVAAGRRVRTLTGHTDRIPALAWRPGSRLLVSAGWDTTARLWNVDTGEPVILLNTHSDQVYTLAFSPDGKLLAVADSAALIHVWSDVTRGEELPVLPGDQEEVRCLAFTPDGRKLAVGGTDRVIHTWDPTAAELIAGHGSQGHHLIDFAPAGAGLLVSTGGSTELQAWDARTGHPSPPAGLVPRPLAVAASPDGRWVAVTNTEPDSRLHIYDVKARTLRPPVEGPRAPMTYLTFSPDSKLLASCCRTDGTTWLWNPADGEPRLIIPESAEGCTVEALAFHPNGAWLACGGIDWLATSGSDGAVNIWNVFDRVRQATFVGGATALAFDPPGQHLAVASPECVIYIWDVATRTQVFDIAGPGTRVTAVAFTPDGRHLLAGCDDHTLRLWDRATGRATCVHELDSPVKALRFTPDGATLYSGNGNTTCHEIPFRNLLET
jgi:WD40 repeat protein